VFSPVQTYRPARWLYLRHVPVVPRMLDRLGLIVFRCIIPHQAEIGPGFAVGYSGFGIVVHRGVRLGCDVFLAHDVTLGDRGAPGRDGVPTIDDVYIAAGARVLGDVVVGTGSVVGANAVVARSAPPRCAAAGVPARVIRENIDVRDYL
jgi:serine O-acetyltransferase